MILTFQVDSEELQLAQKRLLEVLLQRQPGALYPAALCALADLQEVSRAGCNWMATICAILVQLLAALHCLPCCSILSFFVATIAYNRRTCLPLWHAPFDSAGVVAGRAGRCARQG